MKFSEKIVQLRKDNNLTQTELAKKLFVSRQAVSLWENDRAMPSLDTLKLIKKQYNISIDEWMDCSSDLATLDKNKLQEKSKNKIKIIVAIILTLIIVLVTIFEIIYLIKMNNILNPDNYRSNVITRMENIYLVKNYGKDLVFNEDGKPNIICSLPERFQKDGNIYIDGNGNYIRFNSDFSDNIINPLEDTEYIKYYKQKGYESYMDMARKAMYVNLNKVNLFSNKKDIYLAGGAKILREQFCACNDALYYEIDGGLTKNNSTMRLYGFALLFNNTTWLITLRDFNDNYYYITIHDGIEIKNSSENVGKLLSTIAINE